MKKVMVKKINICNLLILIFICEVILIITLINKYYFKANTKLTTLKDIKYLTRYYDFSQLSTLSTNYSYSSIIRMRNTYSKLDNERLRSQYVQNIYYTDGYKRIYCSDTELVADKTIMRNNNGRVSLTIYNCAYNSNGEVLDVQVSLTDFTDYDGDGYVYFYIYPIYSFVGLEKNQYRPIASQVRSESEGFRHNYLTTETSINLTNNQGYPIQFSLNAFRSSVKITFTYKKKNGQIDQSIGNTNGYFYDIDVVGSGDRNNIKKGLFKSSSNSRNEGMIPCDPYNSKIYYNMNRTAKAYRDYSNDTTDTYKLAGSDNGIMIESRSLYNNSKKGNYYVNINSAWYGTSAFMLNDNLRGTMSFYYGGDGCGINYMFMSPVPYEIPRPQKTCNRAKITKGEELTYQITQYVPNIVGQIQLNYEQVYGNFRNLGSGTLNKLLFSDKIDNNLDVLDVKVYRNNVDITRQFNIIVSSNKVEAYANNLTSQNISFYSNSYIKLLIRCRLKSSGVNTSMIYNTGQTTFKFKYGNEINRYTNVVSVKVYYKLKGNVWIENNGINGIKDGYDFNYNGMIVELLDSYGNVINTTKTNANGMYEFNDELPGNRTYYIRFNYNGQIYQCTYYKFDISKGTSNGLESNKQRVDLQNRFATIRGSPNNYLRPNNQWNVAYGIYQKIVNLDDNSLYYIDNRPLLMIDILRKIDNMGIERSNMSIENILWNNFKIYNYRTRNAIINYINDCMITAKTKEISINDISNLGDGNRVDFGVYSRPLTDLAISNDLVVTKFVVNGKISSQFFGQKKSKWNEDDRSKDGFYNGSYSYRLPIKSADYLFNATDYGYNDNTKNIQVYAKYKITIRNNGSTYTKVDSINNWFDANTYTLDDDTCKRIENSCISYKDKEIPINIDIKNEYINNLQKLVITGQNGKILGENGYLAPKEEINIYITFKVKNYETNDKRLIIEDGKVSAIRVIGKRNVCEIGQYETFYKRGVDKIPYLYNNGQLIDKSFSDGMSQGTIDINSNPGSLRDNDFTSSRSLNYYTKRIENDTDQSPELRIKINNVTSKISGTVFEDNRTVQKDNNAVIGDGLLGDKETKINGVTIELVEMVRGVDSNGLPTGKYVDEKIWSSYTYDIQGKIKAENQQIKNNDYYSGIKKSKVIVNSDDNNFKVSEMSNLTDGQYMFDNIPSGDFIIRFKYGDTYRTVLTNDSENIVNKLLKEKGLNTKSYNGQDFKSTIYEKETPKVYAEYYKTHEANEKYTGIKNNYSDVQSFYNNKNYINNIDDYNRYTSNLGDYMNSIQDKLNYYDLNNVSDNDSDAKDVFYYRERGNNFSKELTNYNAEILDSFEKKVQCKNNEAEHQKNSINELINNTSMVSQTGVIDTLRNEQEENEKIDNKTNNINLGLVERAKAQVVLNQEVSNIKVILANGQILYNTDKSVQNLYFGENKKNDVQWNKARNLLTGDNIKEEQQSKKSSLIQTYMDDEIMSGAILQLSYKIVAENKSEIDFNDNVFYYTGEEINVDENLSKLKIKEIVNYVPNSLEFDSKDKGNDNWSVTTAGELIKKDPKESKVNNIYNDTVKTYNTLLVSKYGEKEKLVSESYKNDSEKINESSKFELNLKLNSMMSTGIWEKNNLTYNDLIEIVNVNNDTGRKMEYSIPGNQEMANQSIGTIGNSNQHSSEEYIQVKEIDAASAQKVVALPPTGKNISYRNSIIVAVVVGVIIMVLGIWQIKIHVLENN